MSKKEEHYVDNEMFRKCLIEHKILCEQLNIIYPDPIYPEKNSSNEIKLKKLEIVRNKLGRMFMKICDGVALKPKYINYTQDYKDEMKSDACLIFIKYIYKFDINRKNPFAYFTRLVFNCYLQYVTKKSLYKQKYKSLGYIENIHVDNNMENDVEENLE